MISILDLFKGTTILILTFKSGEIVYYEMAHRAIVIGAALEYDEKKPAECRNPNTVKTCYDS